METRLSALSRTGSPRMSNSSPLIDPHTSLSASQIASSFAQRISVLYRHLTEETFQCHICFDENVAASEAVALTTCGHRFCQPCFKAYLEVKIKEGNVFPLCFHPIENADGTASTCGVPVEATQIQSIVSPEVWQKYLVFRYNKEHEYGRQCPYCSHSQECAGGPETPACTCEQCGKQFCFLHGNAHEQSTCADYELKNAENEALNSATIEQIAKPCPGCKANVEKNGGCNHMKCVSCQASFCWLCGEVVEDVPTPSHFDSSNENGCAGRQFEGSIDPRIMTALQTLHRICLVVCYPFAVAITMLFTLLCCFQSRKSFAERVKRTQTVIITLVALSIVLVVVAVGLAVTLCGVLCYAIVAPVFAFAVVVCEGLKNLGRAVFCCCSNPHQEDLEAGR